MAFFCIEMVVAQDGAGGVNVGANVGDTTKLNR